MCLTQRPQISTHQVWASHSALSMHLKNKNLASFTPSPALVPSVTPILKTEPRTRNLSPSEQAILIKCSRAQAKASPTPGCYKCSLILDSSPELDPTYQPSSLTPLDKARSLYSKHWLGQRSAFLKQFSSPRENQSYFSTLKKESSWLLKTQSNSLSKK